MAKLKCPVLENEDHITRTVSMLPFLIYSFLLLMLYIMAMQFLIRIWLNFIMTNMGKSFLNI